MSECFPVIAALEVLQCRLHRPNPQVGAYKRFISRRMISDATRMALTARCTRFLSLRRYRAAREQVIYGGN